MVRSELYWSTPPEIFLLLLTPSLSRVLVGNSACQTGGQSLSSPFVPVVLKGQESWKIRKGNLSRKSLEREERGKHTDGQTDK